MKFAIFVPAVIIVAVVLAPASSVAQEPQNAVTEFNQRVAAYVALHRQVERGVPRQEVFTDPAVGLKACKVMAEAMRLARPLAREGDIFVAAVSAEFRRIIRRALAEKAMSPSEVLEEIYSEHDPNAPLPAVNERFSWMLGNVMPWFVLQALPRLPEELQYRFVGVDLVLIDIHANLVVDILRDALPQVTY